MKYLIELAEKTFWTYIQALLALVLAGGAATNGFTTDMAIAALPAALTVIANGLPVPATHLDFYPALLFRVVRSAAAGFLGFLLAMPVFDITWDTLHAAGLAALLAALTVIKGAAASKIGDGSPATLPA